jgi:hypothetical protein
MGGLWDKSAGITSRLDTGIGEPGARFLALWRGCRLGGGLFVEGVRSGQRPGPMTNGSDVMRQCLLVAEPATVARLTKEQTS